MKLYYYVKNSEKVGPYTLEELKSKNIQPETLVWFDGLNNWINAINVKELKSFFTTSAPPIYDIPTVPPPILKDNEKYATPQTSKRMFKNPFGSEGRIRRSEYLISNIIIWLYIGLIMTILEEPNSDQISDQNAGIFLFLLIPVCWFGAVQSAKRCHDLGNSGWFQFIPFYHIILLFSEGIRFPNKYGDSPK